MKFGKILVSIYQPGSATILNSIPGLEVIEGLGVSQKFLKKTVFLKTAIIERVNGFISTIDHFISICI